MTYVEDSTNTIATTLRGAMHKAGDLVDSTNLHSLMDAGQEAAARVLAAAPDLPAGFSPDSVDLRSLRDSTVRRAHQIADIIDERADALTPEKTGGHRWRNRLLVLVIAGVAAFYLSRKLSGGNGSSQQEKVEPIEIRRETQVDDDSSAGTTEGESADPGATVPASKTSSNGGGSKEATTS
jgi:hypothetical protein